VLHARQIAKLDAALALTLSRDLSVLVRCSAPMEILRHLNVRHLAFSPAT
jgi:hypothetical protein